MKNNLKTTVRFFTKKISFLGLALLVCLAVMSCSKLQRLDLEGISSAIACMPNGTWKVKTLSIEGVLTNIDSLPNDADYPDISISIPFAAQGYIDGNTFYDMIEFKFEIAKCQQIRFSNYQQFVENELIVRFEQGIDAYVFAANYNHGITPKELLSKSLNIWLLETDGTTLLREIMNDLQQHPDVRYAQYSHTGITIRDGKIEVESFIKNIGNTVKYNVSNNELIFLDSLDSPIIIFNP